MQAEIEHRFDRGAALECPVDSPSRRGSTARLRLPAGFLCVAAALSPWFHASIAPAASAAGHGSESARVESIPQDGRSTEWRSGRFAGLSPDREIVSARTRNDKQFIRDDGTITAVLSQSPVHYLDQQQQWREIVTTLRPNLTGELADHPHAATENDFQVFLPDEADRGTVIRVDDATMLLGLDTELRVEGADGTSLFRIPRISEPARVRDSSAEYAWSSKAIDGAETVRVTRTGIKSELRLSTRPALLDLFGRDEVLVWRERVELPAGWRVEHRPTSAGAVETLVIIDSHGRDAAVLPAPLAFEQTTREVLHAGGDRGTHTEFARESITGSYRVELTADGAFISTVVPIDWLRDPDRRYPVVIDPIVQLYPTPALGWSGYGVSPSVCVCGDSVCGDFVRWKGNAQQRGWMYFDTSAVPDSAAINSTTVSFYVAEVNAPFYYVRRLQTFTNTCGTLWNYMSSGAIYVQSTDLFSVGWRSHLLGSTANADLQQRLPGDYFGVGFDEYDASAEWYCIADGYHFNDPFLTVNYTLGGPSNDECSNAIAIGNGSVAFSTIGASTSSPGAACQSPITNDIWFSYVASCTGPLTVSTCGSANFDSMIFVYSGSNCVGGLLGCNDDTVGCAGNTSIVSVPVTSGSSYRIRVGGHDNGAGTGTLTVSCCTAPTPPAQVSGSATTICAGSSTTLTAVGGSGTSVQWFAGSCGSTVIGTGTSISVSPTSTTTYFARWINSCGASSCASITILVDTPPSAPTSITASPGPNPCAGSLVNLKANGGAGASVQWFAGSCGSAVIGGGTTINVSPTSTTTYFARWINSCGASSCAEITIVPGECATYAGADGGSWLDGANWPGGQLPGPQTAVTIPPGIGVILPSGSVTVGSIKLGTESALTVLGGATLQCTSLGMMGATLSIAAGANFVSTTPLVAGCAGADVLIVHGVLTVPSLQLCAGAELLGGGLIVGNVLNGGTVRPGASVGTLTINGSFAQSSAGELEIEVEGALESQADRLVISSGSGHTAELAGTIFVAIDGFTPELGLAWSVISAPAIFGDAAIVEGSMAGGLDWKATIEGDELTLEVVLEKPLVCWGDNSHGQCAVPPVAGGALPVQVAAGIYHSVALLDSGAILAWGDNQFGQSAAPTLPPGIKATRVAAGVWHSLALLDNGQVVGWGWNLYGQLTAPTPPAGTGYVELSGGGTHSLGLLSNGQLIGWGSNASGQLNIPALPAGVQYVKASAGGDHSAALRSDGVVVCWGANGSGQCTIDPLPEGSKYLDVAAGWLHTIALRLDGAVRGWGDATYGQAADQPALEGGPPLSIAAGWWHSGALRGDGVLQLWGLNASGQSAPVPPLPPGAVYLGLALGGAHSMAFAGAPNSGPPPCPPDLNADGVVDGGDLAVVLGEWGSNSSSDLNRDGIVDGGDLAIVLGNWGPC